MADKKLDKTLDKSYRGPREPADSKPEERSQIRKRWSTEESSIKKTDGTGSIRKTSGPNEQAQEEKRKAAERGAQEAKKYAERQKKYEKAFGGKR